MAQQDVMYGQVSQLMHPSDAPKEGDFSSQPMQRPSPYVGFVPFHQQQSLPVPQQRQPSLSLSLERPDSYTDASLQQYHEGPYRPAPARPFEARPSDVHSYNAQSDTVRPFDLEQKPFQHVEDMTPSVSHVETGHGTTYTETHHSTGMDQVEIPPVSTAVVSLEQENDGLQVVSASECAPQDEDGHQRLYPQASANHEDVIQDAELFMSTLDNFLSALGTRLTIPKLGDKEMNLHAFYCQVTARGGLEQVIRATLWGELSEVLNVLKSVHNTSFVLRKLYTSLLFHYEQVYYFRVEGQLRLPPVPLPAPSPVEQTVDASVYEIPPELKASFKKRKRKLDPLQVFGVDPAGSVGSVATGAINGKFEEGYFVTVVVGTEKLSGVLYHVSADNKAEQYASVPSLIDSIGSDGAASGMEIQLYGCKKRKEYVRKINPNAPKRTRTAYNIFFKEQRARLKQLYPDTKGHGKKVIEMWNKLSDKEKAPYVAQGSQEREKYLAEHREKLRLQELQAPEGANDTGIVQPGGEHDHIAYDASHDYHVSLDVDNDPHSGHTQLSEVDQVYQAYHVNDTQAHISESELTGSHLVSEQAYEAQENEGDYPQEPVSGEDEEDDDAELEEAYEEDEEDQAYPGSENVYEGQDGSEYHVAEPNQDGNDYHVSERESNMPEEAYHPQTDEVEVQEPEVQSSAAASKVQFYGQEHPYNYVSTLAQQQVEGAHVSTHMAPFEQMAPYQMQENGQVYYPGHVQQGRTEASGDNVIRPQQYFNHNRYAFSQARQGQVGEALGLPVPQDQGSFRRQEEASPYLPPFQQSQAMGSSMHARQVPSELAYQERYAYPLPMPYSQMYTRPPHGYSLRFPHPGYPMQMNEGTGLQYGHTYVAQVHQPHASIPEVSGVGTPSPVYQAQDGGHSLRFHDGGSAPVFKHSTHK
ncbi:hypothetical protein GOP47_0026096 [Adiantum capillus-veneris]|uniref:HMG box domain-containing protein n=1 Tax=Adiantum capillus-veneris TaxID=13818 RepID=A0A9D4U1T5_ADICA|nr:hypothetical protein GOP47_0026096 [Adiantum capillus-veneris]